MSNVYKIWIFLNLICCAILFSCKLESPQHAKVDQKSSSLDMVLAYSLPFHAKNQTCRSILDQLVRALFESPVINLPSVLTRGDPELFDRLVSFEKKDWTVKEILDVLSEKTGVPYYLDQGRIIFSKRNNKNEYIDKEEKEDSSVEWK